VQSSRACTLAMEAVSKRFERGIGAVDVSFDLAAGEVVGLWGRRRSGRSTLLRLAAGVERPDAGVVRFEGEDLSRRRGGREQIAVWHTAFPPDHGHTVARQVAIAARRSRTPGDEVHRGALAALARVGLAGHADATPAELDPVEIAHAALARVLVMHPRLLVLDEPMNGLDAFAGQGLLELIVSIARSDRIAVLLSAADVSQLGGVDRHLSISRGVVRGVTSPAPAAVLRLRRA